LDAQRIDLDILSQKRVYAAQQLGDAQLCQLNLLGL
jgi:hypothetical protein